MTFGAPLGLLALLAVPAVIAAYFLRRRQPPRKVSALFLWRTPSQRAEAGPKLERFSREASLLLELAAIIGAALFLSDLHCGSSRPSTHVVVVIDGSLSMQAVSGGRSAADRTRDGIAALVNSSHAGALTIIESGTKPRVLAGPRLETSRALSALERWVPVQPSHEPSAAFLLAKELSSPGQRVTFFTDGPGVEVPDGVEGRSVGVRLENLAFLSVQRRDEKGTATVTTRVANFSDAAREFDVRFGADGVPPQVQHVKVASGATALVRVSLATSGRIEVSLPSDALGVDDRLTVLPAPEPTLPVSVLGDVASPPVLKALKAIDGVQLVDTAAVLVVGPLGTSANVRIGAAGALTSFVGPFFAKKAHPVLDDVQTSGVVWTAGAVNPPGLPLLSAGPVVLMSEDDDGVLFLNLELGRSNVQRSVAWPVLVGNIVRRARQQREGFVRRTAYLGEDVSLVTSAGSAWALEGPNGEKRPVLSVGPTSVGVLGAPGTWALLKEGQAVDRLEVLALDAAESDLRTRGAWSVTPERAAALASLAVERRLGWPWLLAMLVLVMFDFWLTARRRA